jgi:hypothetical protein
VRLDPSVLVRIGADARILAKIFVIYSKRKYSPGRGVADTGLGSLEAISDSDSGM